MESCALGSHYWSILHTLNQVGSLIWEQGISDIHMVLCDRFDVARERALDDLVTLVTQLTEEGLLQQERR